MDEFTRRFSQLSTHRTSYTFASLYTNILSTQALTKCYINAFYICLFFFFIDRFSVVASTSRTDTLIIRE